MKEILVKKNERCKGESCKEIERLLQERILWWKYVLDVLRGMSNYARGTRKFIKRCKNKRGVSYCQIDEMSKIKVKKIKGMQMLQSKHFSLTIFVLKVVEEI